MSACATIQDLEDLAAGRTVHGSVASHLETCAACRSALERIRRNNAAAAEFASAASGAGEPIDLQLPQAHVEGYRILEEIHAGGQGVVYKALHEPTRRVVALKVLLSGAFATSIQRGRFEREIELVAHLQHPNIVTLYDSGLTSDGRLYFTMEHVHGLPLDEFFRTDGGPLAKGAQWGLQERLSLFSTLCAAVNHAHQRGVIHRDLKPGNILVDAGGSPHILDFGLAKAPGGAICGARGPLTMTGEFMGTLSYAAPEQLAGDPNLVDIRADVYSLGVVIYEMLTGRRPHDAKGQVLDLLHAVTDTDPRPPSRCEPLPHSPGASSPPPMKIDDELDTIVMKALSRDRDRRYHSAEALRQDVQRFLRGEPIEAKGDSAWYVLRKTAARYRAPLTLAAVAVLLLVAFTGATWRLYTRAIEERNRADDSARMAERVVAFFDDLFRSANAFSADGSAVEADVTLREVLDLGAARLETGLAEDPAVRARLQENLGTTYLHLGVTDTAERLIERARAAVVKAWGPRHPAVSRLTRLAGQVAAERGNVTLAVKTYRQALREMESASAPDESERATILFHLAKAQAESGDATGAREGFEESLNLRRKLFGARHKDVAESLNGLGFADYALGRPADALAHIRDAYEMRCELLPPDHPDRQESLNNLAILLEGNGEVDEARRMYEEALASARKTLGERHQFVAAILMNLADLQDRMARPDAAEENYRAALKVWRDLRGQDNPLYLFNYAEFLRQHKRLEEAEAQHRACLSLRESLLPTDHLDVVRSRLSLASTLRELKRYPEAEALVQRCLARLEQGDAAQLAGIAGLLMGRLLIDQDRADDALAWLQRGVDCFEGEDADARLRAEALFALGQCLMKLQRPREAQPVLERARREFLSIAEASRAQEALAQLIAACEMLGLADRASELRKELTQDLAATPP
ncbi:MAG: tetratricopeptide repeat protein [Phycisphaerales bacterium]|nr:tetratricopeptide repeat protein [Phycisphaerales bacterium]